MEKFILSIDVSKINKDKLRQNSFKTKNGKMVSQTLCDTVGIPLKEKQLIKEGDGWSMYKVGFIAEKGNNGENNNILGGIIQFENNQDKNTERSQEEKDEEIDTSKIPF